MCFLWKILVVILLSPIIESHGVFKTLKFQRVFTLTKPSLAGRYINFGIYRLVAVLSNFGLVAQKLYDCKLSLVDPNMMMADLYAKEAAHKQKQQSLKDLGCNSDITSP